MRLKELANKSLLALSMRCLAAALGLVANMLIARYLAAEGAGLFYIGLTFAVLLSTFSALGLGSIVLRDAHRISADDKWSNSGNVVGSALVTAFMMAVLFAALLSSLSPVISTHVYEQPGLAPILALMLVGAIPLTMLNLSVQSLRGVRRTSSPFFFQLVVPQSLMCVLIPLFAPQYGVVAVASIYAVAQLLSVCLSLFYLSRKVPIRVPQPPWRGLRQRLQGGSTFLASDVMRILVDWLPLLILGICVDAAQMGIYTIANRTALIIAFLSAALTGIVAPVFASNHKLGHHDKNRSLLLKSSLLLTAVAAPFAAAVIVYSADVMAIFGEEFVAGSGWLGFLVMGQFLATALGLHEIALLMSGRERQVYAVRLWIVPLCFLAGLMLIPTLGAVGAVITSVTCWTLQSLAFARLAWKRQTPAG